MKKKLLIGLAMGFLMFGMVGGANAATVFLDDFEDGDTLGWNTTASGSGSTDIELHNSSQMAFAQQTGSGLHSLSFNLDYTATNILSFDMHAVAYSAYGGQHNSNSGVKFSFLNNFNVELGSAGLVNATTNSWLSANDNPIDSNQHYYNALMSEYAALAGLDNTDPISTFSLTFFTKGSEGFHYSNTGYGHIYNSSSTVWFDDVAVNTNAVPVPGAVWLLSSGLIALGVFRKKKNHYSN